VHQKRILLVACGTLLLTPFGFAQSVSPEEDHRASILGLHIGMTAQDVASRLKRPADAASDQKDHTVLTWKLAEGKLLRVDFWKDHIAALRLVYGYRRPTTDLWLLPLSTPASSTELTSPDPRWRRDYKVTQDNDRMHTVWTRDEAAPEGYHVRISFWSASKKQLGERYGEFVELKDLTVPPEELARFEQAIVAPQKH
jgi:hypothetical protein